MNSDIKLARLPKATYNALQTILEQHGVRIEVRDQEEPPYCLLHLPENTKREPEGFLAVGYEQHKFTLPDGFQIIQCLDAQGWSTIRFREECP